jgi:hypothetical protein
MYKWDDVVKKEKKDPPFYQKSRKKHNPGKRALGCEMYATRIHALRFYSHAGPLHETTRPDP